MKRLVVWVAAAALALVACGSRTGGGPLAPTSTALTGGTIVFDLAIPGADDHRLLTIAPDGTDQHEVRPTGCCAHISPEGGRILLTVSTADGKRVTAATVNLDGSAYHELQIPDPTLWLAGDAWSPDGTRVASEGIDDDPSRAGVYTRRVSDGLDLVRLTDPAELHDWPIAFSPDGSKMLFLRSVPNGGVDDDMNLFVVNTDGTGLVRLNPPGTTSGFIDTPVVTTASWSPDSMQVAFLAAEGSFHAEGRTTARSVFVVDANGHDPHQITPPVSLWSAQWSPDGRWIALIMPRESHTDLFVVHPDGSGLRDANEGASDSFSFGPRWSPDGSKILFVGGHGGYLSDTDLWIVNVDGTGLFQLTHDPGQYSSYSWGPLPVSR
jgi:hypothetical protein